MTEVVSGNKYSLYLAKKIMTWFLFFPNRTYHLFPRGNVINLNEKVLHSSAKTMNCCHESAEVGDALGFVDYLLIVKYMAMKKTVVVRVLITWMCLWPRSRYDHGGQLGLTHSLTFLPPQWIHLLARSATLPCFLWPGIRIVKSSKSINTLSHCHKKSLTGWLTKWSPLFSVDTLHPCSTIRWQKSTATLNSSRKLQTCFLGDLETQLKFWTASETF